MAKKLKSEVQRGTLVLKNGRVWNAKKKNTEKIDVVLKNGKIDALGKVAKTDSMKVVDVKNAYIVPGMIDIHVHLREPGFEEKETIETGLNAAIAGGFTGVCCMPNTNPVIDNQEVVNFIKDRAKNHIGEVYPIGAVTRGSQGETLAEIGFMVKAGIVAISDDGLPVWDSGIMRKALEYSKMFNIPLISHAEEKSITDGGCMNEGYYSTKLGLKGMPTIGEDIMIARDIQLAEYTDGQVHIAHVSSAKAVDLIRKGKENNIQVTGEVMPHHFTLTDAAVESFDTNFKMSPPLRSDKDVSGCIKGLKDGTLEVIATDHAPHHLDAKELEFDQAAFGVIGLETALSVFLTELVDKHGFNELKGIIDFFVVNPRKVIHQDVPEIREGARAELSIIDPNAKWSVSTDYFYSKSHNSCFLGKQVRGRILGVINKNRIWLNNS